MEPAVPYYFAHVGLINTDALAVIHNLDPHVRGIAAVFVHNYSEHHHLDSCVVSALLVDLDVPHNMTDPDNEDVPPFDVRNSPVSACNFHLDRGMCNWDDRMRTDDLRLMNAWELFWLAHLDPEVGQIHLWTLTPAIHLPALVEPVDASVVSLSDASAVAVAGLEVFDHISDASVCSSCRLHRERSFDAAWFSEVVRGRTAGVWGFQLHRLKTGFTTTLSMYSPFLPPHSTLSER